MAKAEQIKDNRTKKTKGLRSLYDTGVNIKVRVLTIIALAAAVGNTLGFLANVFLYGLNFVTDSCAVCAVFMVLYIIYGIKSEYAVGLGRLMLVILCVYEFPLLTLTYGSVMYPYMIIGFLGVVMLSENKRRIYLSLLLGFYDIAIIVYSSVYPYMFGPQDATGLLGSAIITFSISLATITSLIIMWQKVYRLESIELDPVTKTRSRIGFCASVDKILHSEADKEFILLYFNVLSLKTVNAVYGMEGGNKFLCAVAEHLTGSEFAPRVVGRINADRFACLIEKSVFSVDAMDDICRVDFEENGRRVTVNLLCGIYEIKDRGITAESMVDRAGAAIRFIHKSGNKHYIFYNDNVEASYREETTILGEVDKALNAEQFTPFYQPIVDCKTGKIVSAEALARWLHPQMGIINPSVFIPILEKKNLISNLDCIMAEKVNDFVQKKLLAEGKSIPVSLNLSRDDLCDTSMMQLAKSISKPGCGLKFEVTESVYDNISESMYSMLTDLRKRGAEIVIDDFGSGYSSLGMITDYEFDVIKLDIQFASKLSENPKSIEVVKGITDIAHQLGARVVAEGIETEEQYKAVKECGCDYVQGFYFYKPLPANDFLAAIAQQ